MFDVRRSLIRHWETQFSVLKPTRTAHGNRLFSPQDVEYLKVIYHLVKERGMTLEGARRAMKRRAAGGTGVERDAELMTRLKHIRALLVEVREDLKSGGEGIVADDDFAADEPAAEPAPRRRKRAVVKLELADEAPAAVEESPAPEESVPAAVEEISAVVEEVPAVEVEVPVREEETPAAVEEVSAAESPAPETSESEPETLPLETSEPDPEPETLQPTPDPVQPESETPRPTPEPSQPEAGAPKPRPAASRRSRRKSNDDDDKELFAFYEQSLF